MRAVMPEISPAVLQWRRQTGADRWDEMWEGELHMPPMPNREHQSIALDLAFWLRTYWGRPQGNRIHAPVNLASLGGWPNDYRIPDLVLLTPDRFAIDCNEYFEGAPTVVIEIRSPGDESYNKLPFYAKLGVPEVWIIDRDTKMPEVYVLSEGRYDRLDPASDGWLHSAATAVRLRSEKGKLAVQMADDLRTRQLLPED